MRMGEETKIKSMAGTLLARLRWDRATPEEKAEQMRKMAAGRRKARLHRRAKRGAK